MSAYREALIAHHAALDAALAAANAHGAAQTLLDHAAKMRDAAQDACRLADAALAELHPPIRVWLITGGPPIAARLVYADREVIVARLHYGRRIDFRPNGFGAWTGDGFALDGDEIDAAITALRALEDS